MKKKPFVQFTKYLIDFMFLTGIIVCMGVPFIFREAGKHIPIFKENYLPFCIIFMIAGVFALIILWNLRKMLQTVIREDSFVRENVASLKRMGICAFIIAFIMLIRLIFVITPAALVIILVFLVAGLFSLVLSQVFDQAVTYKEENDLTI
ncbi:DUF2975 domain-containing protein [Anaerocolumna sp.]|uniref:DUF2975 domain-containing protein n=1 Tax=Anaerocolumna sp. TaxID=2041569 RepID=UPI0028B17CFB|nr:DUF2975 domain-containing protein [Anaerocolumna sp.]